MLFENQDFETKLSKPACWSESFFRLCDFRQIDTEGGDFDSVFVSCTFDGVVGIGASSIPLCLST